MSISPSSQASAPPESAPGGAVAVLTAAGSGSRLGANVPKALVPVGGTSLLRRATAGLIDAGVVSHLVVTAPADDVERFRAELAGLLDGSSDGALNGTGETVPTRTSWVGTTVEVVSGSPHSRQASVALGLAAALAAVPQADVVIEGHYHQGEQYTIGKQKYINIPSFACEQSYFVVEYDQNIKFARKSVKV